MKKTSTPRNSTTSGQRLLFYIVLNIIISACTTLAILWVWDRARGSPDVSSINQALATLLPRDDPAGQAPLVTPLPGEPAALSGTPPAEPVAGGGLIQVDNVFAAGDLSNEVVLLKRVGDGELVLNDWKLQDSEGNIFVFPSLTLFKDGAVQVHTAAGVNTVVDLYWGRDAAVWQPGDVVTLLDGSGTPQATYRVP
jgi:hypothetical protein